MNYLVDTNVLSEPRQKRPHSVVLAWLKANESNLYTSVLVVGEILYGIELLPVTSAKRRELTAWFEKLVSIMAGRVLSINPRVAEEMGQASGRGSGSKRCAPRGGQSLSCDRAPLSVGYRDQERG